MKRDRCLFDGFCDASRHRSEAARFNHDERAIRASFDKHMDRMLARKPAKGGAKGGANGDG